MDVDAFFTNTLRMNEAYIEGKERVMRTELEMSRNVEFAIYKSAFAGMNGTPVYKRIRKTTDIRTFPWEKQQLRKQALSGEDANEYLIKTFGK